MSPFTKLCGFWSVMETKSCLASELLETKRYRCWRALSSVSRWILSEFRGKGILWVYQCRSDGQCVSFQFQWRVVGARIRLVLDKSTRRAKFHVSWIIMAKWPHLLQLTEAPIYSVYQKPFSCTLVSLHSRSGANRYGSKFVINQIRSPSSIPFPESCDYVISCFSCHSNFSASGHNCLASNDRTLEHNDLFHVRGARSPVVTVQLQCRIMPLLVHSLTNYVFSQIILRQVTLYFAGPRDHRHLVRGNVYNNIRFGGFAAYERLARRLRHCGRGLGTILPHRGTWSAGLSSPDQHQSYKFVPAPY